MTSLPSEAFSVQQKSYVTYTISETSSFKQKELPVTLLEARNVLAGSGTTGLRTWEAALHLGKYLSTQTGVHLIKGQRILEIGAGTGFLSILCAKHLGPTYVVATDGDDGVVESLKTNIFLNGLDASSSISSKRYSWGWPLPSEGNNDQNVPFDLVLGADVVGKGYASVILELSMHCSDLTGLRLDLRQ
jgi:predicted nicotinamide N-methyase